MLPEHYNQFSTFQTTTSESNRGGAPHITDVKAIQISTSSKEKVLHATAENTVIQGQATIKNGAVTEANSAVLDRTAFNVKASISAALQYMVRMPKHLFMTQY